MPFPLTISGSPKAICVLNNGQFLYIAHSDATQGGFAAYDISNSLLTYPMNARQQARYAISTDSTRIYIGNDPATNLNNNIYRILTSDYSQPNYPNPWLYPNGVVSGLPNALANSPSFLYVTDSSNNLIGRVGTNVVGDPTDVIRTYIVKSGTGTYTVADLSGPTGLYWHDPSGSLFILSANNNKIIEWSETTHTVRNTYDISGSTNLYGLTYDPSGRKLYTADISNQQIVTYDISNAVSNAVYLAGLGTPSGLVYSKGYLYVGDSQDNQIQRYATPLVPTGGWPVTSLVSPWGLGLDDISGYLYVSQVPSISFSGGGLFQVSLNTGLYDAVITDISGGPIATDASGRNLYLAVAGGANKRLYRVSLNTPTVYTTWLADGILSEPPGALTTNGTYLYCTQLVANKITRINLSNVADISANFITNVAAQGVCYYPPDSLYVTVPTQPYLQQYTLSTGRFVREYLLDCGANPQLTSITTDVGNLTLYITDASNNNITTFNTFTHVSRLFGLGDLSGAKSIIYSPSKTDVYVANYNAGTVTRYGTPFVYVCFKEGTQILTDAGYRKIQDLRKGDLVKTARDGYKPIHEIAKSPIHHRATKDRNANQLYSCAPSNYPELFEELVITGSHAILVDSLTDKERKHILTDLGTIYGTGPKYRLPAYIDERTSVYPKPGDYTIYHFALENTDSRRNYGVYANGLLVESCSIRYLKELSNMVAIA